MKVNVAVQPLQLLADGVSVSSSSQSVCSTMSSFRDPLLASFEEELLNSSQKPALAKTQTSWSKMKGLMCSPRQGGRSNSLGANLNCNAVPNGEQSPGRSRHYSHKTSSVVSAGSRRHSADSRRQITISVSQESENSALSFRSGTIPHASDVSNFADTLARRVLCEAITAAYCPKLDTVDAGRDKVVINVYSDLLAQTILADAMVTVEILNSDWLEQNKVVTWSDEVKNEQISVENESEPEVEMRQVYR